MTRALALLPCAALASACIQPSDPQQGPFYEGDPALVGLALVCDQDRGAWELRSEADFWTGGGTLYVTRDGTEVENHRVASVLSAGDGSWDCLTATLAQSVDRRDFSSGSTSRWLCDDAAALSFLFVVVDPTGESETDCLAWGADPGVWATVDAVPACDVAQADDDGVVLDGFDECD